MIHRTTLGLDERVERVLTYSLGWVTGLIFLFGEKNANVRWHAVQSIVTFGSLTILMVGVSMLKTTLAWIPLLSLITNFGLGLLVNILWWVTVFLWFWLMFMAYTHPNYRLPFIGDIMRSFL